jgi:uncharacterized protein YbjT (DUF2867 family)
MILVAGATGQLGGMIARQLLQRGDAVRVLVRKSSSHSELAEAGADIASGDLKDRESLDTACSGVEAVVTTANSMARGGEDTIDSVDRAGNVDLIDAAAGQGVRRFVFVSALGASLESPMPLLRAKAEAEQHLRLSDMAWTVLEPNAYLDMLLPAVIGDPPIAGQTLTLIGEGRRRHSFVAVRDVAAYAVAVLHSVEAESQILLIGGPEAVSWRDVVAAVDRELDRELQVRFVPMGEPVAGMPGFVHELLTALETYDSPLDMAPLAARYGVLPTSLAEFVHGIVTADSPGASPDTS